VDSTAASDTAYDYSVQAVGGSGDGPVATTRTIKTPSIIHSRGKALVVVDNTLYAQSSFGPSLDNFLGRPRWRRVEVVTKRMLGGITWDQMRGMAEVKSFIIANKTNAKAVILFGHVVIPYSGPKRATDIRSMRPLGGRHVLR
jgi:hypothetical protein